MTTALGLGRFHGTGREPDVPLPARTSRPGRFLRRAAPSDVPERGPSVSPQQMAAFAFHAGSLAARVESLPAPADPDLARQRQERLERLRWAAAAGAAVSRDDDRSALRLSAT